MRRLLRCASCAGIVWLCVSAAAWAQSSPAATREADRAPAPGAAAPALQEEGPDAYESAIDAGLREHQQGHFEEAREHFREAHARRPTARTWRALGKTEFELRNYGEAVHALEAALASNDRPLDADLRSEVEALLERARTYVGEIHLDIDPGAATVSVDGRAVARGPRASLLLVVGSHLLEFQADGHLGERRSVWVNGREKISLRVVLPSDGPKEATVELLPVAPASGDVAPERRKWWAWTVAGLVLVGAAVATGVLVHKNNSGSDYNGGSLHRVVEPPQ